MSKAASKARRDVYEDVTAAILKTLNEGAPAWSRPWASPAGVDYRRAGLMPHNAATGRRYNGVNVFLLWAAQMERGFEHQAWLTFNQAKGMGASVRKGAKSELVIFFKTIDVDDEAAPDGQRKVPVARAFRVFNIAEIDGLPERLATPRPAQAFAWTPDQARDAFIANTGAPFALDGGDAAYCRGRETIHMPAREAFKTGDDFYATAFHELAHWTGHKSRLDRNFDKRFHGHGYAMEELVAELTASFICAETGTVFLSQAAAYIGGWKKALEASNRAFIAAASAAQAGADHLWSYQPAELLPELNKPSEEVAAALAA